MTNVPANAPKYYPAQKVKYSVQQVVAVNAKNHNQLEDVQEILNGVMKRVNVFVTIPKKSVTEANISIQ